MKPKTAPISHVNADIEEDFAYLARLASDEAYQDVRLYLARLVRKYRTLNPKFAANLDLALRNSQTRSSGPSVLRRDTHSGQSPVDADSRLSLIRICDDTVGMAAPLLSASLESQTAAIVRERQERDKLLERGISPTRSVIMVGPPGVGKTLTARWIAHRLGKPLWILDLATIMSSLLGKTGNNLRAALDHAKANQAVLLLDEIDAIAKRRSDESDIGELKRLVTVILQEVDQWPDTGLLLAATNHPELVDPALWRRFDTVLTFDLPSTSAIEAAIPRFLGNDKAVFEPWIDVLVKTFAGKSLSDVERAVASLRRAVVFGGVEMHELVKGVTDIDVTALPHAQRLQYAVLLAQGGLHSHHEINRITGISRDTIRKHAGHSPLKGRGRK